MASGVEREDRPKLEIFDGSDPSNYRAWKRRAKLMIAGLPSTVSSSKFGARLMEFVKGEAEALLETVDVEEIIKDGGDKAVFAILDEKYLPQPRDLLQNALKGYFYDLNIKSGETYPQFITRYDTAVRKLREQQVDLPEVVKGFMLLRKLKLDVNQESMVLSATHGKMEMKEVIEKVRAIFPEGKGASRRQDVFEALDEADGKKEPSGHYDQVETLEEVLEVITDPLQNSGDEEEALEIFETYAEVRRKLQEKRKGRGFQANRDEASQWKVHGTLRGRLEMLKQKTKCHLCKRTGHWKRECPERVSKGAAGSQNKSKEKEAHATEVMSAEVITIDADNARHERVWQLFEEAGEKAVTWKTSVDVQQEGFSDTHATGNQQRSGDSHGRFMKIETAVATKVDESPMLEKEYDKLHLGNQGGQEALSAEDLGFSKDGFDEILSRNAVPDTAYRRTLIGAYTLRRLEQHLLKLGKIIIKRSEHSEFRFGNNETLISKEVAIIPACVQGRRLLIKAAILPAGGCRTPLLLSKEFLRELGTEIDLGGDYVFFRRLGVGVKLGETMRGHYAIPMFDFGNECFGHEVVDKQRTKTYDVTALEKREQESSEPSVSRDPAVPSHEWCSEPRGRSDAHDGEREDVQTDGWYDRAGARCRAGLPGGWQSVPSPRKHDADGGQVCQEGEERSDLPAVRDRQALHPVGADTHQQQLVHGDAEASSVYPPERCNEKRTDSATPSFARPGDTSELYGMDGKSGDDVPRVLHRGQLSTEHDLEPCRQWSETSTTPAQPSSSGRAAANVGGDGAGDRSHASDPRAGHDGAPAAHGHQDALQVLDEHHHLRLSVDYDEFTNVQDSRPVSSCDTISEEEEKENACVMSKRVRRQIEKNVHDINICMEEMKQHGNIETCETDGTCDLFHVSLEHGSCDVSEVFFHATCVTCC